MIFLSLVTYFNCCEKDEKFQMCHPTIKKIKRQKVCYIFHVNDEKHENNPGMMATILTANADNAAWC